MDVRTNCPTNNGDWWSKFGETWKTQAAQLKAKFADGVEELLMPQEALTEVPILFVKKELIIEVLKFLKTETGFEYDFLSDITATDEESDPRFLVIYNLYSMSRHNRIRIKVRVAEGEEVPTAIPVWAGANWAEREIFDMFGIRFAGHPDLRRILMDSRWQGHPLRKDYPIRGYQIFPTPEQVNTDLLK